MTRFARVRAVAAASIVAAGVLIVAAPPADAGVRESAGTQESAGAREPAGAGQPGAGDLLATSAVTLAQPVGRAVSLAAAAASLRGVTAEISVVDRATGAVVAQTANADRPVASESIVKLVIAAYQLLAAGGYRAAPPALTARLAYMLEYSDDATASALFRPAAIPTIARRYGLSVTANAAGDAGHWGAAQISAADMTTFLAKAAADSLVGPWLIPVMARTAPRGSDGYDQDFGLNALTGVHGSKQGWGDDTPGGAAAIHSVGYTDRYFVAILQTGPRGSAVMRQTATNAARLIAASVETPIADGSFVNFGGATYRVAGGAPIRVASWASVGGVHPAARLAPAAVATLAALPADGTFVRAGGITYRIVGGAPIRVASWVSVGGVQPTTVIDPAAITHAGSGGTWDHLRQYPADGTFVRAGGSTYEITGGVPVRVASWASVGGVHPTTVIDPAAITHAGSGGAWDHLRQ